MRGCSKIVSVSLGTDDDSAKFIEKTLNKCIRRAIDILFPGRVTERISLFDSHLQYVLLNGDYFADIALFNDSNQTTFEEVRAVAKKADELLQKEEPELYQFIVLTATTGEVPT